MKVDILFFSLDQYLVIISIAIFLLSIKLLLDRKPKGDSSTIGFIYLVLIHAIVGLGYNFTALYISFNLGELFAPLRFGSISILTYWYLLIINISLLVLNQTWSRYAKSHNLKKTKPGFLRFRALIVMGILLPLYYLGIEFNTLGVGLKLKYILPYRMNGIIEVAILYLIPFFGSLAFYGSKIRSTIGTILVLLYGILNITIFGSKFAAIFPVLVYTTVQVSLGGFRISGFVLPGMFLMVVYVLLNPYYFRNALSTGYNNTIIDAITNSYESGWKQAYYRHGFAQSILYGTRNMAQRIVGFEMMDIAIKITKINAGVHIDATGYLNNLLSTNINSSVAPGHFGYFILASGNSLVGLGFSILILFLYLLLMLWLEYKDMMSSFIIPKMMGITVISGLTALLIDGNYGWSSPYLQLLFSLVFIFVFLRWFIVPTNIPKK